MPTLIETGHGGSASARWFFGRAHCHPRTVHPHGRVLELRGIMAAHFARFLPACRIAVDLDGPATTLGTGCVLCYNETSVAADLYGNPSCQKNGCRG